MAKRRELRNNCPLGSPTCQPTMSSLGKDVSLLSYDLISPSRTLRWAGGKGLPSGLRKRAGGYFRIYALVWVFRKLSTLLVHRHRRVGNVLFGGREWGSGPCAHECCCCPLASLRRRCRRRRCSTFSPLHESELPRVLTTAATQGLGGFSLLLSLFFLRHHCARVHVSTLHSARPRPRCDIPSGCGFFTGPWTVSHPFLPSRAASGQCCLPPPPPPPSPANTATGTSRFPIEAAPSRAPARLWPSAPS